MNTCVRYHIVGFTVHLLIYLYNYLSFILFIRLTVLLFTISF